MSPNKSKTLTGLGKMVDHLNEINVRAIKMDSLMSQMAARANAIAFDEDVLSNTEKNNIRILAKQIETIEAKIRPLRERIANKHNRLLHK